MENSILVGMWAADRNDTKLGRICSINKAPVKNTQKLERHLIIMVEGFLKRNVKIPLHPSKILKVEEPYIWFDISKEEFDEEVKLTRALKQHREDYIAQEDEYTPSMSMSSTAAYSGMAIQPRPRSKRKK